MEYNVNRFLVEQNNKDRLDSPNLSNFERAFKEIKHGQKVSDWIWYVFPQGPFGVTEKSINFSIKSVEEAITFLADPILGNRLRTITQEILKHSDKDIERIMARDKKNSKPQ